MQSTTISPPRDAEIAVAEETPATTRPIPRLDSLTSLRFFAALLVVWHHAAIQFLYGTHIVATSARPGFVGVTFFFVLSGFVLTWSRKSGTSARVFWWRRFARIYPLHFVMLIVAALALGSYEHSVKPGTFLPSLFLVQSWWSDDAVPGRLNGVSWTLACEAFFYLMFPVAIAILAKRRGLTLVIVSAGAIALTFVIDLWVFRHFGKPTAMTITTKNPALRISEFVLGICLALSIQRGWRPRIPLSVATLLVSLSYLAIANLADGRMHFGLMWDGWVMSMAMIPSMALLILSAVVSDVRERSRVLSSRFLVLLGAASYSLYMIHYVPTLWVRWHHSFGLTDPSMAHRAAYLAVFMALCTLGSIAVYKLFEHPVERVLRRFGNKHFAN